jgi:hypothetical protein
MSVKNTKKDMLVHVFAYVDKAIKFHMARIQQLDQMILDKPEIRSGCNIEINEHYRTIASYLYLIEPLKECMLAELPYNAREAIIEINRYLNTVHEVVVKGEEDERAIQADAGPVSNDIQHDEQSV